MGALDKGVNQIYAILNDPAQVKSQVIPLVDSLKGLGSQYRQVGSYLTVAFEGPAYVQHDSD